MTTKNNLTKCRQKENISICKHINTVCNDKSKSPRKLQWYICCRRSYYETDGKSHASPHLSLFQKIMKELCFLLTIFRMEKIRIHFSLWFYESSRLQWTERIKKNSHQHFTREGCVWEGGSTSQFSPVMIFKLWERFSEDSLEVSEIIEVNEEEHFGYDDPIVYKRKIFVWSYLTTHHVIMFSKL